MKVSFITTVFNEERSIQGLLDSIFEQSVVPDEVIIVDGGSTDKTVDRIKNYELRIKGEKTKNSKRKTQNSNLKLTVLVKKGNRAVGRNEAVRKASGGIIVCSDAGCVLDSDWVKNIVAPFFSKSYLEGVMSFDRLRAATIKGEELSEVDVVAGYYVGKPTSLFQKCLVPYVLVMPDRVKTQSFLPSTRSMAFRKSVWEKTGGFPEEYTYNEDYVFANKLKKMGANIIFAKDALVFWQPRKNLKEAFNMFYLFAYGDMQAGIIQSKVLFIFLRYIIGLVLLVYAIISGSIILLYLLFIILYFYCGWAIGKNYKYVRNAGAVFLLPILQVTSDIAVMFGTSMGFVQRFLGGGYTRDTIKGVSWMGALRGTTRGISFVRIAILARVLTPFQFGAFGIASLVLSFIEVVTETGVNVVLVQEKGSIENHINSAWVLSILRGFLIALLIFVSAPFIASFFHSKDAVLLLQLIAIVPILRGFINPSVVSFQKNLEFGKEFWYRFLVFSVDAFATIFFAITTKQAASIVYGLIVGACFEAVISFFIAAPRPRFTFESVYIKKIFHRGKWVTLYGAFNYLFHNGDNIVVGKLLNTQALGLYQMAYSLSILPISEVADVVSRVAFPVYTKISEDRSRLRIAFLKTLAVIAVLTIPFGFVLFFFPSQITLLVLGEKWLGVVQILRILGIFGVIRAISGFASSLFIAVGKQEYVTVVTFVSFMGLLLSIVPMVLKYGIIGAGISAMIGTVVAIPFFFYYTVKIFSIPKINSH